jgi:hypothetical protein
LRLEQNRAIKFSQIFTVFSAVMFISAVSSADMENAFVMCKHEKAVRTLRIDVGNNQKCRAVYTKQGVDETVGNSTVMSDCEEVVIKIRKHLEEGNWNCRDVKEARISTVQTSSEQ